METVVVAVGSNLGDRLKTIQKAGKFIEKLSDGLVEKGSIWESEPVGPAKYTFLNTAVKFETSLSPAELLKELKLFEQQCGREENPERWGPRILDLDIIRYGNLVIQKESLIIPHSEYSRRLFVLLPMLQIDARWCDPQLEMTIQAMIEKAPQIDIQKTELNW
jgi:2-amino-4-hydroxy-6-hydroxymethyldihydropteridine diphosphokinase